MLSKKRGQVTVFVALGIIVAAIFILAIVFRGDIAKVVTETATGSKQGFSAQVNEVQTHVEGCLEKSLQESSMRLATRRVTDYETDMATDMEMGLGRCLDFTQFKDVSVHETGSPKITVKKDSTNTQLTATLILPLTVEKGTNSERLDTFVAKESLTKTICVLKEKLDSNCRATEDLIAGGFIFTQGQEVKIGGKCLAC